MGFTIGVELAYLSKTNQEMGMAAVFVLAVAGVAAYKAMH